MYVGVRFVKESVVSRAPAAVKTAGVARRRRIGVVVDGVRLDGRRQRAHVAHGPLLLAALHRVQKVRNGDRRQDADDRDDDQQLDQGEARMALFHGAFRLPRRKAGAIVGRDLNDFIPMTYIMRPSGAWPKGVSAGPRR